MAELQEAGDDVLIPASQEGVRELRNLASLNRAVWIWGPVVEKPPQRGEHYEIRLHSGVVEDSVFWNVTLCLNVFPDVSKERSAFMCEAQAALERRAFLRCWLFFVD